MKIVRIVLFVMAVFIGLETVADDKKIVSIQVEPGAFTTGQVEVLGAWLAYGSARAKYFSCTGYIYSFEEELEARKAMIDFWKKRKAEASSLTNKYMDYMVSVRSIGYLEEYVWHHYFKNNSIVQPKSLEVKKFESWLVNEKHDPETQVRIELNPSACKNT